MLAKKNQYLREMGVDVWVLREGRQRQMAVPAESTPAAESAPPPAAAVSASTPKRVKMPVAPQPQFHLCFATYGDLSLVFSVPKTSSALPEPLRRFADDIARALGRQDTPAINALRWPLVQSADFDQSEAAARLVIGQRLSNCGKRRLIFGDEAAAWTRQGDEMVVAEISTYLEDPITKRDLWQMLRKVKP